MTLVPEDAHKPKAYLGIMVSSTFSDIREHRAEAKRIIEERQMLARVMERDSAKSQDVIESSLEMVRDTAAYVGVITHKYGQTPLCPDRNPTGLSLTELEYNEAQRLGRPILLFIMGEHHKGERSDFEQDPDKLAKLTAFRERAKKALPGSDVDRVYATFEDLDEFKEKAANAISALAASLAARSPDPPLGTLGTEVRSIDQEVPCPQIFGRDDDLREIVEAIVDGRSVVIAGGPGFGKSALAVCALYAPEIVDRFGSHRVFVALDSDREPRAILARMADALGLVSTGDDASLLRQLEINASKGATVVVLDNLEAVFENAWDAAERLVQLANQIPHLCLILTIRGTAPRLPNALVIQDLSKLLPPYDEKAFLAVAGQEFASDPCLDPLLKTLDGHALSLQLVAARAAATPELAPLLEAWHEVHAAILTDPHALEGRLTSVRASLALSLNSSFLRSSPLSRRLLGIISLLPGGLAEEHASRLLGERGTVPKSKIIQAVAVLQRLRLVERRLDRRLRMLNPLRECVRLDVHVGGEDHLRLIKLFVNIAQEGNKAGTVNWAIVKDGVKAEMLNLGPICDVALSSGYSALEVYKAILGLAEIRRVSGFGDVSLLEKALSICEESGELGRASHLCYIIGQIKRDSATDEEVLRLYERGRLLAKDKRHALQRANCIFGIADIYLAESKHEAAIEHYDQALPIYASFDAGKSEANCWFGIAILDYRGQDKSAALESMRLCQELYRKNQGWLGENNARMHVALINGDKNEMKRVLMRYGELGADLAESDALTYLAWMEAKDGNLDESLPLIKRAVEMAQSAGDVTGEGIARVRHGQILRMSEQNSGIEEISTGLGLYKSRRTRDRALRGLEFLESAFLLPNESERASNLECAKQAWSEIGRFDLVREWTEFGVVK